MNQLNVQTDRKRKNNINTMSKPVSNQHSSTVKSILRSNNTRRDKNNILTGEFDKATENKKRPRIISSVKKIQLDNHQLDKSLGPGSIEQDQTINMSSLTAHSNGVEINASVAGGESTSEYPDGYRWTQTISTNVPLGGTTSPYVDPRPNDDNKPFYYTDAEHARLSPTFYDRPSRPTPSSGTTRWTATLSLNGVNGTTVTSFDTMSYGFELDSAGTVSVIGASSVSKASHQSILASEFPSWTFA